MTGETSEKKRLIGHLRALGLDDTWTCLSHLWLSDQTEGDQSMSTSLLYHALGIRGYTYVRTTYGRRLVFTVPSSAPVGLAATAPLTLVSYRSFYHAIVSRL